MTEHQFHLENSLERMNSLLVAANQRMFNILLKRGTTEDTRRQLTHLLEEAAKVVNTIPDRPDKETPNGY